MFLGYGDYMNECERYMNEACISDKCPYYGEGIVYCYDCQYIEINCSECIFHNTVECPKVREGR